VTTLLAALILVTGDALRHLLLGVDHRLSTSKAQVAAWTYLVLFALCTLMLMGKSLNCPTGSETGCVQIRAPLARAFDAFLTKGLQPSYLLLLGLPTAAAVAAKAITTTKIATAEARGSRRPRRPLPTPTWRSATGWPSWSATTAATPTSVTSRTSCSTC
jgi:hypothetical protein